MAGVKGRSGGARPGAGRKPKSVTVALEPPAHGGALKRSKAPERPAPTAAATPLEFLKGVMNDLEQDPKLRVRAAIAAAQYEHLKKGDGGKKDEAAGKAKKAAGGRFAAAAPPLKLVGRK